MDGGGREEETVNACPHVLSLIGLPLWHFKTLLLWPGRKEEEEGGRGDIIENSGILADRMIGAAAFLLSRDVERRGVCATYNKYGRRCSDWQLQDKSNLGCRQQVGG